MMLKKMLQRLTNKRNQGILTRWKCSQTPENIEIGTPNRTSLDFGRGLGGRREESSVCFTVDFMKYGDGACYCQDDNMFNHLMK